MPLQLEVVTAERVVFSDEVDRLVAPGLEGALGILPRHAPLMSVLGIGELRITRGAEVTELAIGGGFMEVLNDRVTVLADSAERADEIDEARAEEAIQRAQRALSERGSAQSSAVFDASLRKAQIRLRVARRRRSVQGGRPTP